MARRKSKSRGRSKGRGRRARSATKRRVQHSKQTTITIKNKRGRPERTTIYEEYYEEEW